MKDLNQNFLNGSYLRGLMSRSTDVFDQVSFALDLIDLICVHEAAHNEKKAIICMKRKNMGMMEIYVSDEKGYPKRREGFKESLCFSINLNCENVYNTLNELKLRQQESNSVKYTLLEELSAGQVVDMIRFELCWFY